MQSKRITIYILAFLILFILIRFSFSLLLIAARFWYVWILIVGYILFKQHEKSKVKRNKKDTVTDAEFTIIEDDGDENEKK